jgi:hypothetical protein
VPAAFHAGIQDILLIALGLARAEFAGNHGAPIGIDVAAPEAEASDHLWLISEDGSAVTAEATILLNCILCSWISPWRRSEFR